MTNSEKRRYVADAIRFYAHESYDSAYEFLKGYWPNGLADLIDPTCHNQHPRASDGCFCCSECLFLYEPTDRSACRNGFLYCPRCGARVARGGED